MQHDSEIGHSGFICLLHFTGYVMGLANQLFGYWNTALGLSLIFLRQIGTLCPGIPLNTYCAAVSHSPISQHCLIWILLSPVRLFFGSWIFFSLSPASLRKLLNVQGDSHGLMSEDSCDVVLCTESLIWEICCTSCNQSERGFYAGLCSVYVGWSYDCNQKHCWRYV